MQPAVPETFDRAALPSLGFLYALPAEQRGVFHSLRDALKQAKDVIFRIGGTPLDNRQIARLAREDEAVLERVVPSLIQYGYMQRDTDGALYSPHLVERQIRRAERVAAKAEREARQAELEVRQLAGDVPQGASVRVITSPRNGLRGGRPRAGETKEEAYARRLAEAENVQRKQRQMPLVSVISGSEGKNQTHFEKQGLVSELGSDQDIRFPVDLESEKDISPSNSKSTEPTETEISPIRISEAELSQIVARVLKVGRLEERQAGFAKSICRKYLISGIPADILVEAVKQHCEKMALNGDTPDKMSVYRKPIERFWADHQAGVSTAQPEPETPDPERDAWEKEAVEAYGRALKLRSEMFTHHRDLTALERDWPAKARQQKLPSCEVTREAYLAWYRPKGQAA
ncbi:hypothetical protein [Gluconobacter morbifer]|uniref:Uncharacterized protein n=1 Tax=Gluconobacter morbifer G707 TaxID=1088869 RepID=G6XIX0_9PROT|nr:hypothetical protein [Gluconobacter morbifer]EHH68400.1 hypothetical protein GMO_11700 [Gluconobacter morbifer G707]